MIQIDIPADLAVADASGVVRARLRRDCALLKPGAVVIAGRPEHWSWVRLVSVEEMVASFVLISEKEAASVVELVAPPSPSIDWPWPRIPWLRLEADTYVALDAHTYMWLHHFQFSIDPDLSDKELIAGLVSSKEYAHDFASPYGYGADVGFEERPIHARWLADMLTPEMFTRVDPEESRRTIHSWMDEELIDPPQTARTHARVDAVLDDALGAGAVHQLDVPDNEELKHSYGWVVGVTGFHEYVTIDRTNESMHLVVASDD